MKTNFSNQVEIQINQLIMVSIIKIHFAFSGLLLIEYSIELQKPIYGNPINVKKRNMWWKNEFTHCLAYRT